jgi:hypothetical protein
MDDIGEADGGKGETTASHMVDQSERYDYVKEMPEDHVFADLDGDAERIHGPNYRLLGKYPYTRNIRTGKPMRTEHHCPERPDHHRELSCYKEGHIDFCTVLTWYKERWVRCGESFSVKSDGCEHHTMPAGYNKISQWFWLQFQQKRNELTWEGLKVYAECTGQPEEKVEVDEKQKLIEETEKELEAKSEAPEVIQERDQLHYKLKQSQKIQQKDRRKALAASRTAKGAFGATGTNPTKAVPVEVRGVERGPVVAAQDPLNPAHDQPKVSTRVDKIFEKFKDLATGNKAKKGGGSKLWAGTKKHQEAVARAAALQNAPETAASPAPDAFAEPQPEVERLDKYGRMFGQTKKQKQKTVGGTKKKDKAS